MKKSKVYAFINAVKRIRDTLSDEVAIENIDFYPDWTVNEKLLMGDRVQYNGKLYRVLQDHTTQSTWTPINAVTLFQPIDIINDGSLERPFIAVTGMIYYKDKYYFDETDGNIYLCTRDDTGNGTPLYYMPSDLVGAYFSLVS